MSAQPLDRISCEQCGTNVDIGDVDFGVLDGQPRSRALCPECRHSMLLRRVNAEVHEPRVLLWIGVGFLVVGFLLLLRAGAFLL